MNDNLIFAIALLRNLLESARADSVSVDLADHWQRKREQTLTDLTDNILSGLVEKGYDERRLLDTLQRLIDRRRLNFQDGTLEELSQ